MEKGFNLIGYATSPMGLGEDLRTFSLLLDELNIEYSIIDLPTDAKGLVAAAWKKLTVGSYSVSIFFMSPMECRKLYQANPQLFTLPNKTIGYFLWELPEFPSAHHEALNLVNQIWCPTEFVQEALQKNTKKLTLRIPLPVPKYAISKINFREIFNIPSDAFVVLYMFDMHSTLLRKNPDATIRVFLEFLKTHKKSHLILKITRANRFKPLDWLEGLQNVHIIKDNLSINDLAALYSCANCYLSLHRSEGFGRTLVEAMHFGLFIIATNFSGPADYLTELNCLQVRWVKRELVTGDYPYSENNWWSEPDENHALTLLGQAYRKSRKSRNINGIETAENFTPYKMAKKYKGVIQSLFL